MSLLSPFSFSEIRVQAKFPAVLGNSPQCLISHPLLLPFLFFYHPPVLPFQTLISLPFFPSLLSLSFIQFNFELGAGRQAKRVAPWLPGTGPSHYTANWFWPAATSAAYLPPPHPTPSTISAPQTVCSKGDFRTHRKERGKQLHLRTSNLARSHAPLDKLTAQTN